MLQQPGLDLAQLDARAGDLHLVIRAAKEFHPAIDAPAREVAALVQAERRRRVLLSRITRGQESLRGEVRTIEVAPRQSISREVHLTDDAAGHGTKLLVEDVDAGIGSGSSDRHREGEILFHVVAVNHATDRGLGRTIFVVDIDGAAEVIGDLARQRSFEILAAYDELANPGGAEIHVFDHREMRGRELYDIDRTALDDFEDRHARHSGVLPDDHDTTTRNERGEDRCHREIERQRGEQRPGQAFAAAVPLLGPPDVIHQAAVLDHHTLGCAGGARRVNDVGETVGGGRPPGIHHR